ncbi:Tyr/Ser kinase, virus assembly, IFN-gamma inhibitor [Eptesipox virus]|uniref:Tyr/Ser kinase, virus assembly, IFN-gamma inhibitor n=1 Tax=Eptesipox virus TaxID=1329402 RepID=A0A220T6D8_9POXV|nr:Tyr/Ser kinase, virus assembly, IFN-gamma inhibitor [Eptesipox virus]ASK51277.1 Tyr/Ser kinase, virus assembly, IFN-gamma inhibitor [Eptesipox virus]WAH71035.1 Tyr/Ser kinase, virus assembly, IFN-gamma inhibitor [Eptesipox virus]
MDKKSLYENVLLKSTGSLPKARAPTKMTRVTEYVYLGNYNDAMNIHKSGIDFKYILNLTTEKYTLLCSNVTILHIPLYDDTKTNVSQYFDYVTNFLANCDTRKEPILVHCVAGVNRSGVMICAYLMSKRQKNIPAFIYFLYIYHSMREQRGAFVENPSFRKQIIEKYILEDN